MMAIVLVSGGLDSVVTLYYIRKAKKLKNLKIIFFDYNQRGLKEEKFCVEKISKFLRIPAVFVDFRFLNKFSTSLINKNKKIPKTSSNNLKNVKQGRKEIINWWVPARNSLFLLTALAFAESNYIKKGVKEDIYLGIKNEGRVPMKDTTKEFIKKINELVYYSVNSGNFKFKAPLINYDKDEIVKLGSKLKVPFEYTFSCYISSGFKKVNGKKIPVHCGYCESCMQRKKAFYWANIKDPSIYLK